MFLKIFVTVVFKVMDWIPLIIIHYRHTRYVKIHGNYVMFELLTDIDMVLSWNEAFAVVSANARTETPKTNNKYKYMSYDSSESSTSHVF